MKRNWKTVQPTSLIDAMRLAKEYARERHNLSVERIADLIGVTHHDLYKWLANGRMPATLIPVYELACQCHFVSLWLVHSTGKMVIELPTGRDASAGDLNHLQVVVHEAVGQIIKFHNSSSDAPTAMSAIQSGLESLAWHRANIEKHAQPELEL